MSERIGGVIAAACFFAAIAAGFLLVALLVHSRRNRE